MSEISDLNLSMQNVMPAQVYLPVEPQPIPDENKHEIESELPADRLKDGSSSSCSCVDTYA
ncbi:MAG: hypothetical protein OEV78_08385 [Spirochaetia bacterium]|nr:hypothetical protein [Spirochaetia bacterium]